MVKHSKNFWELTKKFYSIKTHFNLNLYTQKGGISWEHIMEKFSCFQGLRIFSCYRNFRTYLGLVRISCSQEFCLIDTFNRENKVCRLQQTMTWLMSAYSLTADRLLLLVCHAITFRAHCKGFPVFISSWQFILQSTACLLTITC